MIWAGIAGLVFFLAWLLNRKIKEQQLKEVASRIEQEVADYVHKEVTHDRAAAINKLRRNPANPGDNQSSGPGV